MEYKRCLSNRDALTTSHRLACEALNDVFMHADNIVRICRELNAGNGRDESYCKFLHSPDTRLNPNSKAIVTLMFRDVELNMEELYYYIHLAYTRYAHESTSHPYLACFANGLDYFRKACDIKGTVHKEATQQPQ